MKTGKINPSSFAHPLVALAIAGIVLVGGSAAANDLALMNESQYRILLCSGLEQNRYLPNQTYVDCVTDSHAIEVDFSHKWAEAIGQALMYASELERLPGIILICHPNTSYSSCIRHRYLLEQTVTYWRIGMTVWYCEADNRALAECLHSDLMGP